MTATDLAAGYSAYTSADEVALAVVADDRAAAADPTTSILTTVCT